MQEKGRKKEAVILWLLPAVVVLAGMALGKLLGPKPINPTSHDPVLANASYSKLLKKWQGLDFRPVSTIEDDTDGQFLGLQLERLDEAKRRALVAQVRGLILGHAHRDYAVLQEALWPYEIRSKMGDPQLSSSGMNYLAFVTGVPMGERTNWLSRPVWKVLEDAWSVAVMRAGTNWWTGIATEPNAFWLHRLRSLAELPSYDRQPYGDTAGLTWGTSILTSRLLSQPGSARRLDSELLVAAVRIIVRHGDFPKPTPLIFRWIWREARGVGFWMPLDSCVCIVGRRPPDPFF